MITTVLVVLGLIAIAMLGCLLVLTWGCLSAAAEFAAARYRAFRSARPATDSDVAAAEAGS